MPLLSLQDAELAFGLHPLLDRASLTVDDGERIGLIGRNGTGKSSLLNVIADRAHLDDGDIKRRDGLRVVLVEQEPELPAASSLRESLALRGRLTDHNPDFHDERERWRVEARLVEFLHRFGLDEATDPRAASGGERKRAALALALALDARPAAAGRADEPPRHRRHRAARGPAAPAADLDRDHARPRRFSTAWRPGSSSSTAGCCARIPATSPPTRRARRTNLRPSPSPTGSSTSSGSRRRRGSARASRRGARATWDGCAGWRPCGASARSGASGWATSSSTLDAGERSGKLVAELEHVTKRFGDRTVVNDLDLRVMRGDRLGVIGPNGAGKSTLLKLILGTLAPDAGTVRLGTQARRRVLRPAARAARPRAHARRHDQPGLRVGEARRRRPARAHVSRRISCFRRERANAPVRTLSGGERNRLLLARLFAQPANLLVLDEPTNDLDIESLELLEATLQSYSGTLLLVSHDRTFLDNVVTQTLVAEGPGGTWKEYVGGYSDWVAQRPAPTSASAQAAPQAQACKPRQRTRKRRSRRAARRSSRSRSSANWSRCPRRSRRSSASSST